MQLAYRKKLLVVACLAALILWSCGLGTASIGFPTPPSGAIKVSQSAADDMERTFRAQLLDNTRRELRLSMTDEQITSFIALKANSVPLYKPQVWFMQGKAFVRGTFTGLCLIRPEALVVASVRVQDKRLIVTVQQVIVARSMCRATG